MTPTVDEWVVPFNRGRADDKSLLGGKGANLAEMTRLGLPVPPGFIVTTQACRSYLRDATVPANLYAQVDAALDDLEQATGRRLGDARRPLLLSVRSGAAFSMPGMMDTVLNLGATPATVEGLAQLGDERFAWDAVRRFLEMFGRVVLGVDDARFRANLEAAVQRAGVGTERDLDTAATAALAQAHRRTIADAGHQLPEDPREQLRAAIEAVFRSWNGARARAYRRVERIPDELGTAVNIQAMVFGNLTQRSATGVAFTRDPATGEAVAYGDFLMGAQGEDVVAGTRVVQPLDELADHLPDAYDELLDHLRTLERHWRDLCDVEFTVEDGHLWMLQTRVGKRSAAAAVRIAVDMVDESMIDTEEAVRRVQPEQLEQLLHPRFAAGVDEVLTTGLAASPGAAVGTICFEADEAVARTAAGEAVILVRDETSPEDLEGMMASVGLLTARGGLVSHAAVVARGFGKPAICGASSLRIDPVARTVTVGDVVLTDRDIIAIDGTSGQVVAGEVELVEPSHDARVERLLAWADDHRTMGVYANADTASDAARALEAGAEGIGLCRTEHQFLGDRLPLIQAVILADEPQEEERALAALEAAQTDDFEALLEVMDARTTVIRLLDPPLHEFLPDVTTLVVAQATGSLDADGERLLARARDLQEHDPMLGTRGLRLGVLRPAIYRAQVRAILTASSRLLARGADPRPQIMLPLVATAEELAWGVALIRQVADEVMHVHGEVAYTVSTMIETPRAALQGAQLAPLVDAFSFGTNDLTQLTFGLSRDDVEATYIPVAVEQGLLAVEPFRHLDEDGVGRLMAMAISEGRAVVDDLTVGICGEHGGDPASIRLGYRLGLTYVSCSAARVRVARLAAAHASLEVAGPSHGA